jgi:hypothetical protein
LSFPNPVPLNFNPNNKVSVYRTKAEYQVLEQKLDALSEDKKVINLLYIDQLNQDYDNPILRKELIALAKDLRDSAKEIILKADSGSETNDKDYVFSILF